MSSKGEEGSRYSQCAKAMLDIDVSGDNSAFCASSRHGSCSTLANLSFYYRFIGVADIASVRFSLPSQLLEPTPNLEYWNYLDQPNTFVAIGQSDDELERTLEVLRFWFTKDLKYVKGKPCKVSWVRRNILGIKLTGVAI